MNACVLGARVEANDIHARGHGRFDGIEIGPLAGGVVQRSAGHAVATDAPFGQHHRRPAGGPGEPLPDNRGDRRQLRP